MHILIMNTFEIQSSCVFSNKFSKVVSYVCIFKITPIFFSGYKISNIALIRIQILQNGPVLIVYECLIKIQY